MKLFLLIVVSLSISMQTLAAPNNAQLNKKIRTLQSRVALLEDAVSNLKKSSSSFAFAGFTAEHIDPVMPDAFIACRSEFGPDASISNTREVLQALREGTFQARGDGYVFSSDVQYDAGVARDKYLLEIVHGQFIVVGVGGKTSQYTVEEAPVACSRPIKANSANADAK